MRMKLASLLLLALLVGGVGCHTQLPAFAPDVPNSEEISKIEIYEGVLEYANQTKVIRDSDLIAEVLTLIRNHASEWHVPTTTYPTPQTTALFKGQRDETLYVLWLGPDWVGGDDSVVDSAKYRMASMEQQHFQRLEGLLGRGGV